MSLKSKIEAVIYASEEPVTLQQLVGLLAEETDSELRALDAMQTRLPLEDLAGEPGSGMEKDADQTDSQSAAAASETGIVAESRSPSMDGAKAVHVSGDVQETMAGSVGADANRETTTLPAPVEDGSAEISELNLSELDVNPRAARERDRQVRDHLRRTIDSLIREYADSDRGIEIREVAGGFRMGTKPEYHDAVRGFVKSLKPALKLTLQALETLAVGAYKQPGTAAEISEIRGVDSAGVLGGLIGRKLITTAGRKQVIGRPMLYKTTKEFLVRFGLKDVHELPSMEEFERLAGELNEQDDLPMEPTEAIVERVNARGDADHSREVTGTVDAIDADAVHADDVDREKDQEPVPDTSGSSVPEPGVADSDGPVGTEQATVDTPASNDHTNTP